MYITGTKQPLISSWIVNNSAAGDLPWVSDKIYQINSLLVWLQILYNKALSSNTSYLEAHVAFSDCV